MEQAHVHFEQIQPYAKDLLPSERGAGYLTRSGHCLWLLGFPEQAQQRMVKVLHIGRENANQALSMILHHYLLIVILCGDFAVAGNLSTELVELTAERNDVTFYRFGRIYQGWLLVHQGNFDDGLILIRKNADEHRARGNYLFECFLRSLLAEAYIGASDLVAAQDEIDGALAYAQESGDCHWNAQLRKLRGDTLLASNAPGVEVEHQYQLAIDTARKQKARSLELCATTSLCRLWLKQGKFAEAHQLLSDIYGWFTEGFDTHDLMEARALLDELAVSTG